MGKARCCCYGGGNVTCFDLWVELNGLSTDSESDLCQSGMVVGKPWLFMTSLSPEIRHHHHHQHHWYRHRCRLQWWSRFSCLPLCLQGSLEMQLRCRQE